MLVLCAPSGRPGGGDISEELSVSSRPTMRPRPGASYCRSPSKELDGIRPPQESTYYHICRVCDWNSTADGEKPTFDDEKALAPCTTQQPIMTRHSQPSSTCSNSASAASPASMFHPLNALQKHSHTMRRVIGQCYAVSIVQKTHLGGCWPVSASAALFRDHVVIRFGTQMCELG